MADMQGALRYDRERAADAADPLSHFARMIAPGEVVLDLGCGPGVLGRMTQAITACTFEGVEIDEEAALRAETHYQRIYRADLDRVVLGDLLGPRLYSTIVLADVLEHLVTPGHLLAQLGPYLAPGGRLLISIPNIGYFGLVAELLAGRFTYRPYGLLDRTHLRFFTRESLTTFLALGGFEVIMMGTINRPLAETEFNSGAFESLNPAGQAALLAGKDAEVFQFMAEVRPRALPPGRADICESLAYPRPEFRAT
jgi:2-polyprenyl-3-methyl-5-hydroxy-6-metoxy-1,4-benzoquinol methylase